MNKFIFAFALVACVAVASAQPFEDEASELSLFASDEVETAGLRGDKLLFHDFCLSSRDEIRTYIKTSMGQGSNQLFNTIAETVSTIASSIGEAYNKAIKEHGEVISSGDVNIGSALMVLTSAVTGSTKSKVMEQIESLRSQLTTGNLQDAADTACDKISGELRSKIDRKLKAYIRDLTSSNSGPEVMNAVTNAKLNNIGCLTAGRLSKVATACIFMRTMAPSVFEMLGY